MQSGFARLCANASPGHEVRQKLWRGGVQEADGAGNAQVVDLLQQLPAHPQASVDHEGLVERRIEDEALPVGGARGLEKHPHDQTQVACQSARLSLQSLRILQRSAGIVHTAWAHDNDKSVIISMEDCLHIGAATHDSGFAFPCHGKLRHQKLRAHHRSHLPDPEVVHLGIGKMLGEVASISPCSLPRSCTILLSPFWPGAANCHRPSSDVSNRRHE
mmetsp:Transcript_3227/g.9277  ORF Transcript_3227/g.9277 Transcript_3227/m.9277 type:complete len:217 (+) Transcript_3227:716-1366(+)